jgi:uncharacterized protein (TIGR03435 family)
MAAAIAGAVAFAAALSPNIWKPPDVTASSTTKTLADGSRIELRAGAEAVVGSVSDGLMVRLHSGSMMVFAAEQAAGQHLYVQTRDLKVSVVGTVFLVNADDEGSRVAVMEGEVHVQQGTVEKRLRPGEQLASNPKSPALDSDREFFPETGWSPEASAYLSKLQESTAQNLATRQSSRGTSSVSDKPKFEEASIRPCEQDLPAAGRGGGGSSGSIRLSPGRVDALCMTVATLITVAHRSLENNPPGRIALPMNVTSSYPAGDGTRVRGGPDWVRSDKYTIAAVGDSTDAATLQGPMLMDLLERRFNLKLRVETEEIPFYALTIAEGGLKIKPLENDSVKYEELRKVRASGQRGPGPVRRLLFPPDSASLLGCSPTNLVPGSDGRYVEALRRDGQPPMCDFAASFPGPNTLINSGASPLSLLVVSLGVASGSLRPTQETLGRSLSDTLNGLLILDKTGLPDTNCLNAIPSAGTPCAPLFNYFLEYATDESDLRRGGRTPTDAELLRPRAPNVFDALEKLGLHLEKSKAPREFIFIEHIERLSPN